MELRMDNGRYVCDDRGNPVSVSGIGEIMERVTFLLRCRRGKFPLLPDLGSRLYLLPYERRHDVETAAASMISEALAGEREVILRSVASSFEGDRILLSVVLSCRNTDITANLTI